MVSHRTRKKVEHAVTVFAKTSGDVGGRVANDRDRRLHTLAIALCAAMMLSSNIRAGEASATFTVSVRVVAACQVHTEELTLTPYTTGGSGSATQTPGSIDVACTKGTPAQVILEGEQLLHGPSGASVAYTLTANGTVWSAGSALSVIGKGLTPVHLAIGGAIAGGHELEPGEYSNSQVVRVTF